MSASEIAAGLSPGSIVKALRSDPDVALVRHMPEGYFIEPREVWIPTLGAWVRADGKSASGDSRHRFARFYPGLIGRLRIRLAVREALSSTGEK